MRTDENGCAMGSVVRRCRRRPLLQCTGPDTAAPNSLPDPYRRIDNFFKMPAGPAPWVRAARWRRITTAISGSRSAAAPTAARTASSIPSWNSISAEISSKRSAAGCWCSRTASSSTSADHIWVTDAQVGDGKGDDVLEFDQNGKLLRTLGKPGYAGSGPDTFMNPTRCWWPRTAISSWVMARAR